jgi:predicted DNA-binding mobile mystery protein A
MTYWDRKLILEQFEAKLQKFSSLRLISNPEKGWIKAIREALSMSTRDLGKKVNLSQSRISRLENAEIDGDLKISSLKKMAERLNMTFVYAFVPNEPMEKIVRDQAMKIALKRFEKLNHTMRLEDQEITANEKSKALEDLVEKILHNPPKDFWLQ